MFGPFTHLKYCHINVRFQIRNRHLRGGYLLVHDQTAINSRSVPSHLGNSWDANVPSTSAMLTNKSVGGKLTLKR